MNRRWVAGTAIAVLVLLALIPLGRWEARRHARNEVAGIRRVLAAIGPVDQPSLDAYRLNVAAGAKPGFNCLAYRRGNNPFALEFCFTQQGRVIEGYDRRGTSPRIWSIREDPGRSPIVMDVAKLDALLKRLQQPVK
jgi:hypothetical protein